MTLSETVSIWIPAVSGLLGALIGGAISYLTLRQQLRHTSKEARLAREYELKRQVYLDAAEGIARSVKYLASISRSDLTIQELSDIPGETGAWAYRVQAVASLDTIKAVDQANEFFLCHTMDLMVKRLKWEELRSETEEIHDRMTQLGSQAEQLVAALQALSSPDTPSEACVLANQVMQDVRDVYAEMTELARSCSHASDRQLDAHRDLVEAGWKAITKQASFLSQAIVHIRRELEMPLDENGYLVHIEESSARCLARLNELWGKLDQLNKE